MTYALHVIRVLLTPARHAPVAQQLLPFPALDTARWTAMIETARRVS